MPSRPAAPPRPRPSADGPPARAPTPTVRPAGRAPSGPSRGPDCRSVPGRVRGPARHPRRRPGSPSPAGPSGAGGTARPAASAAVPPRNAHGREAARGARPAGSADAAGRPGWAAGPRPCCRRADPPRRRRGTGPADRARRAPRARYGRCRGRRAARPRWDGSACWPEPPAPTAGSARVPCVGRRTDRPAGEVERTTAAAPSARVPPRSCPRRAAAVPSPSSDRSSRSARAAGPGTAGCRAPPAP